MLRIGFPLSSVERIEDVMPDGYRTESGEYERPSFIVTTASDKMVGFFEIQNEMVLISFYEESEEGKMFALLFGKKNSELNPKKEMQGLVFEVAKGVYKLDTLTLVQRGKAMGEIIPYLIAGKVFLVSYFLGECSKNWIKVKSMRNVMVDSRPGEELGPQTLRLGSTVDWSRLE